MRECLLYKIYKIVINLVIFPKELNTHDFGKMVTFKYCKQIRLNRYVQNKSYFGHLP